ncbi:MAG: hypothetical protein QXH21_10680 [Ignisphaera sp.]
MVRVTYIELIDRIYLIGPPGIGKTEIVRQKAIEEARRKGKKFVDLREASSEQIDEILKNPKEFYVYYRIIATHIFPEDLGIPRERNDFIEFLPPKVLKILSIPDVEGVLFIDELNNVQRDDQISMLYSIIQEKEASWILKLSQGIKIVCAGNPSEWSEIVRALPIPLRSRLTIVRVDPPTIDEWIKYMDEKYGNDWERLVAAYLKTYPSDFIAMPEADDDNYPCPRNWTEVSVLLHKFNNNDEFKEEIVIGRLGRNVGVKLLSILRTKIDVARIVVELSHDPSIFSKLKIEEKVLVLNHIAQQDINELQKIRKFMEYLAENDREMLTLVVVLMSKEKRVQFIKEFKDVAVKLLKTISQFM